MRALRKKPVLVLAIGAAVLVGGGAAGLKLTTDPAGAAAPAVSEPERPADCDARLEAARAATSETASRLAALATAETAERCEAYRAHLAHVVAAGETYEMCAAGFRGEDMARQAALSEANWRGVLEATCEAGGPAP